MRCRWQRVAAAAAAADGGGGARLKCDPIINHRLQPTPLDILSLMTQTSDNSNVTIIGLRASILE